VTFRLRLALAAALVVAATVAAASAVVYAVMRNELHTSVDHELQQQYQQVFSSGYLRHVFDDRAFPAPPQAPSASAIYLQIVTTDGTPHLPMNESEKVPVSKETIAVAAQKRGPFFVNGDVGKQRSRIYTVYGGQIIDSNGNTHRFALQLVRSTDDIDRTLGRLRLILLLVFAGGLAAGASPCDASPRPRSASRRRASRASACPSAAATSSRGSGTPSTRCSARSRNRSRRSADSSRTRRTSCAPR
jgi:hypothetical protein